MRSDYISQISHKPHPKVLHASHMRIPTMPVGYSDLIPATIPF